MAYHTNKPSSSASGLKKQKIQRLSPEVKYYDYTTLSGSIGQNPNGWSAYYVPAITRGTERYSRIGNQIVSRSIELRMGIQRNAGGAVVQRVKILVARNKDPMGQSAGVTEIFQAGNLFDPMRNPDYASNYVFYFYREFVLTSTEPFARVDAKIPLNFKTRYASNNGTIGDVCENNVELFVWSDQAATQPTLTEGTFRFNFTDE